MYLRIISTRHLLVAICSYLCVWMAATARADGLFLAENLSLSATVDGQTTFQKVTFSSAFNTAPVVVITANTDNTDPATVRIRNVTQTGFEVAVIEPAGEDGEGPAMNNLSFFAAEPGLYLTDSGELVEVGFHETTSGRSKNGADNYDTINFSHGFTAAPSLTGMIQTMNNETANVPGDPSNAWMTMGIRNLGSGSFDTTMDRAETSSSADFATAERLGYIAFEASTGNFNDNDGTNILWDAFISADNVTGYANGGTSTSYNQAFSTTPLIAARSADDDGADGGWVRYTSNDSSDVTLMIDEDRTSDTDRSHTDRAVSVLAFSEAFLETLTRQTIIEWAAGGGDNNTTTNANWNGWDGTNASLNTGDALLYDNTGSARTTSSVDASYTTGIGQLRFEETTAYTIDDGGGSLTFADGGSIVNNSNQQQTFNVDINASGGTLGINANSADFVFNSATTFDLSDTSGVEMHVGGSNNTTISGQITGAGGKLIKTGSGTLTLDGNSSNTYTGMTTVHAGTLELNKSGGATAIEGDLTLEGGSVVLTAADQINTASNVTFDGGELDINGHATELNHLTLAANSVIDFGTGEVDLLFNDLTFDNGVLYIYNWTGSWTTYGIAGVDDGSVDRLLFTNIGSYSVGDTTSNVLFFSDSGTSGGLLGYRGKFVNAAGGGYELVPIPEASQLCGLTCLIATLLFIRHQRDKKRTRQAHEE